MSEQSRRRRRTTVDLTGRLKGNASRKTSFVPNKNAYDNVDPELGGARVHRPSYFEQHKDLFKKPAHADRPTVFAPILDENENNDADATDEYGDALLYTKSQTLDPFDGEEDDGEEDEQGEYLQTDFDDQLGNTDSRNSIAQAQQQGRALGRKETRRTPPMQSDVPDHSLYDMGDELGMSQSADYDFGDAAMSQADYDLAASRTSNPSYDEASPHLTKPSYEQATLAQSTSTAEYFDVAELPQAQPLPQTPVAERLQHRRKSSMLAELMTKKGSATERLHETDAFNVSSLHRAAREGDVHAVSFIIETDPSLVSAKASNGATPAHDAAATGNVQCLRLLLLQEPTIARSKLKSNQAGLIHIASMFGQVNVVRLLIDKKYASPRERAANGSTPLHYAAMGGHLDCVQYLAAQLTRDEVNATNDDNATALHRACVSNHPQCVRELIKHGSDPNIISTNGVDAIQLSVRRGHIEVVTILLDEFEHLILRCSHDGASLWHFACAAGHPVLLEQLFEYAKENDVDPMVVWADKFGNTPVHDAAANGNLDCLNVLLDRDLDVTLKNSDGKTPADLAREHSHTECAILLTLRAA